jgi:hypothetical protein
VLVRPKDKGEVDQYIRKRNEVSMEGPEFGSLFERAAGKLKSRIKNENSQ